MQAASATWQLDEARVEEAYRRAQAERWQLPFASFAAQLLASAQRAFPDRVPAQRDLDPYFASLHLEDLALACACAEGIESAWDHFVTEYRPALYRAADTIDPSGNARELADSLYGELFGLTTQHGERRSHFRYFHGRSPLTAWLRAVLAQRYVDGLRRGSRIDPLPDDDAPNALAARTSPHPGGASRYIDIMRRVMASVIAVLPPRDRLRMSCYYLQDLTLAQIGRLLGEHEATVSRKLARTRRGVRAQVEAALRGEGMGEEEVRECVAAVVQDPGPFDLRQILSDEAPERKKVLRDRSQ